MYRSYHRRFRSQAEYEDYDCGGFAADCEGCECCEVEVSSNKYVVARKARKGIRPGDLVAVTTGFSYQKNGGPRLGYFKRERVIGYGPGHGPEKMGNGWHSTRGGFRANHPAFADEAEARMAREKAEAEAEQARIKAEREAAEAARKAEQSVVSRAADGDTVEYQGKTWTVGPWWTKLVVHSNLEYAGGAGDATAYSVRTLTNTETGETRIFRP